MVRFCEDFGGMGVTRAGGAGVQAVWCWMQAVFLGIQAQSEWVQAVFNCFQAIFEKCRRSCSIFRRFRRPHP
ncbi:hypothetical protein N783_13295 [Pontibacillus marinus BH030004 = DSM 16465]|uniref:Uncharacterized protein n=1 Tax=Pontibacillus marinus BH030004 = DSM 16465 TaxID=1385511 RepID=A0A0A5GCU7_9BACI|nr:hypothetical protein N783_13295 [Pontibacillus marinus BH030004 = DSM 16465]